MDIDEILWTTLLYLEEGGKLSTLCEKAVKKQLKDTNLSPEGKYSHRIVNSGQYAS